jgi:hypothetical protein
MFGALCNLQQGLDWNQSRWIRNHRDKTHHDNPYTTMTMREMDKATKRMVQFFEEANFNPERVAEESY